MANIRVKQTKPGVWRVMCGNSYLHGVHTSWLAAAKRALNHYKTGHFNEDS